MANVASYHVLVYGSPDGYQTNRSQISLYDAAGKTVAFVGTGVEPVGEGE